MNGSITKHRRTNGRVSWGYHFRTVKDEAGEWIRVTRQGFETKDEAKEALRKAWEAYEAAASAPATKPLPAAVPNFAEYFATWLDEHARMHCQPKTVEHYEQVGAYAIGQFGAVALTDLSTETLEAALNALWKHGGRKTTEYPDGRPLSPKTIRETAFLTSVVLKRATARGLIPKNPVVFGSGFITLPKPSKKKAPFLEKEALRAFVDRARTTRLFPLLVLAAATGARRGELLALQWSDVDFETGLMLITKSLEETKAGLRVKCTKSEEPRQFIVPNAALEVLEQLKAEQARDKQLLGSDYEDVNLIFCRPEGGYLRPDKVSVRVTELARKCGLKGIGLHALRHTHASELLSKGVPLAAVAERLGHRNANVTLSIYTHALKVDKQAAAKIWNDTMADVIQEGRKKAGPVRVSGFVMSENKKSTK